MYKKHTQNQTKVIHKSCTQKLYTKATHKSYTQKLYTKAVHKSCTQRHINCIQNQTKVIHKSYTQKLYTKVIHKSCIKTHTHKQTKVVYKSCTQKLYKKCIHKSCTQKKSSTEKLHKISIKIYFFQAKPKKMIFFPVKIRKSRLFRWIFIQENIKPKSDFLMGTARCPTGECCAGL